MIDGIDEEWLRSQTAGAVRKAVRDLAKHRLDAMREAVARGDLFEARGHHEAAVCLEQLVKELTAKKEGQDGG